ncbi:MAG TPA: ABC transporter ATP-binding protein [Candidatus Sericytochromatia bacterium]
MTSSNYFAIQTHGLTKAYKQKPVLNPLNLNVPKNSIFGFLGPNGAGKSTTMKMLIGAIRPTGGRGVIFGMDIVKDSVKIRQKIGYLAQDIRFYPDMTPRQTLQFCASFFPLEPGVNLKQRIDEMLELVGLQDKADRKVQGFSGGERQRLGIAQAQIHSPDLLILDEPTAALDPMGRYDVLQIMKQLQQQTTIFFSTHILDDVQKVCDQVAILKQGQLVAQGPIEQVMAGGEGVVFTLSTKGDVGQIQQVLSQQSWVSSISTKVMEGQVYWEIGVTDEQKAEANLLRLVLTNQNAIVSQFGRKSYELEDIFMSLVAGENQ